MLWRLRHPLHGLAVGVLFFIIAALVLSRFTDVGTAELALMLVVAGIVAVAVGKSRRRSDA